MEISELTLRLIVLLVPGAIAALIVDKLTFHRPWSPFYFVVFSALLGSISYFCYQIFLYIIMGISALLSGQPFQPKSLTFWNALFDKDIPISLTEVMVVCCISVLIGYLASAIINRKTLFSTARSVRVSNKFGEEDLWAYFLNSPDVEWIWLRDYNRDLAYDGYVDSFSVTPPVREILLREVRVYSNSTGELLYEVPALYVTGTSTDLAIELPIFEEEVWRNGGEEAQRNT